MVAVYKPDYTIGLILTPITVPIPFGSSKRDAITRKLDQGEKYHLQTVTAGMADDEKRSRLFDTLRSAEESITSLVDFPEVVLRNNLNHFKIPFPLKVQEMLADVEKQGNSHIVSWLPHGKSFRVHKEEEFVAYILPCYFNQSKLTSFTRQLYMYSFQKVQDGPDQGAFFHEKFIRGDKTLCQSIKRKKDKKLSHPNKISASSCAKPSRNGGGDAGGTRRRTVNAKLDPVNLPQSQATAPTQPLITNTSSLFSQKLTASALQDHLTPTAHQKAMEVTNQEAKRGPQDEDWLATYERLTSMSLTPNIPNANKMQPPLSMPISAGGKLQASTQIKPTEATTEQPNHSGDNDWLSKYERLTARAIALERSVAMATSSLPIQPGSDIHPVSASLPIGSSNADSNEVNRDAGDMLSAALDRVSFVSRNAGAGPMPHIPSNANTIVAQTNQQQQQPQLALMAQHQADEQRIHPTTAGAPFSAPYDRSFPSLAKESDSYSDGDQVDFEGMTFHFVQPGSGNAGGPKQT